MDFTVIPNRLRDFLANAGLPLTEDQYLLITGALAQQQQMIAELGIEKTITLLHAMKDA